LRDRERERTRYAEGVTERTSVLQRVRARERELNRERMTDRASACKRERERAREQVRDRECMFVCERVIVCVFA